MNTYSSPLNNPGVLHVTMTGMPRGLVLALAAMACLLSLPAAAAESADSPSSSPSPPPQYILDSGDRISIQVFNEEDMHREVVVDDRGIISYPFIGEISVRGMNAAKLENFIATELKGEFFINPRVFVDITEYRPFYVNGEVESPGSFPFQPGITVRKAISIAGGFKERASKSKIFVIRETGDNEPFKVTLDAQVTPGDIITVEQSFF